MPRRAGGWVAALALAVVLPACGGGGGGTTPSTVPPAPQPVRTLLFQGNFNLAGISEARGAGFPYDALAHEFTLGAAGTVEVNADWTFPGSQIAVIVTRGPCSFAQLFAEACAEAGGVFPSAKPNRLILASLPAGTYTLVIANINDHREAGNYQLFVTR